MITAEIKKEGSVFKITIKKGKENIDVIIVDKIRVIIDKGGKKCFTS